MRTLIVSIVLATIGLGIGSAVAYYRVSTTSSPVIARDILTGRHEKEQNREKERKDAPRVEVPKEKYDFGEMDGNGTGKHDFVIKNVGTKPLTLQKGDTTCKCTLSKLEKEQLPPGKSGKVTLEWKGGGITGDYRHSATIKTNDPDRPLVTLSIVGKITHAIRVLPHQVVFSRLRDDETATAEANVLAYLPESLKIESTKWSDADIADKFSFVMEPLSKQAVTEVDEKAKEGYVVKITVKPGLGLGSFRQKLLLKTNYKAVPEVEVPIEGMVDTDIAVVGRGWNSRANVLRIGTIDNRALPTSRKLLLLIRGPSRKAVNFEATDVFPKELKVDLTKPVEINDGTAVKVEMKLEIPEGCRPMNHLGSSENELGCITLKTGCEKTPEIKVYVQFAVLGG